MFVKRSLVSHLPISAFWKRSPRSRVALIACLSFSVFPLCFGVESRAEDAKMTPADWQEIRKLATDFVARESPDSVWFYKRANRTELEKAPRKVFAHYFTPFPLSIDNRPPPYDYYARELLQRTGEQNKYFKQGGYLRQRPLPMPPWNKVHWREIGLAIEVLRADLIGLDGFGIDLLKVDGPLWSRTQTLYDAAAAVAPSFRIVAEPDMASLADVSEPRLVTALAALLARPAAYRLPDGRYLVVPFLAENRPPEFWQQLSDDLAALGLPIALMPDFLDAGGKAAYAPMSYGFTYWGTRDPAAVADHSTEQVFAAYAKPPKFALMAPVAPQDQRPKDAIFWEARNTAAFRDLWMQAIEGPAQYVHLITWNDYSEASEISPSTGTQFVFYDLAAYFTQWFKLGDEPRSEHDAIFYTQRRQILRPDEKFKPDDKPFELRGLTKLSNQIEMIAFLKSPATLEIELGTQKFEKPGHIGMNIFYIASQPGRAVFRIRRGSAISVEKTSDWPITDRPDRQDPLYAGGSSTRPFVPAAPNTP